MQYRRLSLQENFGTTNIQPFKEAKGVPVANSSFDTGGNVPIRPSSKVTHGYALQAQQHSMQNATDNRTIEPAIKCKATIIVSLVIFAGVTAILYYYYARRRNEEKSELSISDIAIPQRSAAQ